MTPEARVLLVDITLTGRRLEESIVAQIRAAVAEEREACAAVAEAERDCRLSLASASEHDGEAEWATIMRLRSATAETIADVIRARSHP